jgi:hypothetical protein
VNLGEICPHSSQFCYIALKNRVRADAVLQAGKIDPKFSRSYRGQAVDHPVGFAAADDETAGLQIPEMFGDFYLWLAEQLLEVADAKRAMNEQMEDAKAGPIAKTGIDFDEIHTMLYSHRRIYVNRNMDADCEMVLEQEWASAAAFVAIYPDRKRPVLATFGPG